MPKRAPELAEHGHPGERFCTHCARCSTRHFAPWGRRAEQCRLEATPGIEPGYADLQSAASPLRHVASKHSKRHARLLARTPPPRRSSTSECLHERTGWPSIIVLEEVTRCSARLFRACGSLSVAGRWDLAYIIGGLSRRVWGHRASNCGPHRPSKGVRIEGRLTRHG